MSLREVFLFGEDRVQDVQRNALVDEWIDGIVRYASEIRLIDEPLVDETGRASFSYSLDLRDELGVPFVLNLLLNEKKSSKGFVMFEHRFGPWLCSARNMWADVVEGWVGIALVVTCDGLRGDGLKRYGVPLLAEEIRQEWGSVLSKNRDDVSHEFVHALDMMSQGANRFLTARAKSLGRKGSVYQTVPAELNANIMPALKAVAAGAPVSTTPQQFARYVVSFMHRSAGERYLKGDDLKRVMKRAATYWEHLKQGE
jgi:hypothetical protein